MKTKKFEKKLNLNKNTIVNLTEKEMKTQKGGYEETDFGKACSLPCFTEYGPQCTFTCPQNC